MVQFVINAALTIIAIPTMLLAFICAWYFLLYMFDVLLDDRKEKTDV